MHKDKNHRLFTIKLHIMSRTVFLLDTYTMIVTNIIPVYRKICRKWCLVVPDGTLYIQIHTPMKGITNSIVLCHKTDTFRHLSQSIHP